MLSRGACGPHGSDPRRGSTATEGTGDQAARSRPTRQGDRAQAVPALGRWPGARRVVKSRTAGARSRGRYAVDRANRASCAARPRLAGSDGISPRVQVMNRTDRGGGGKEGARIDRRTVPGNRRVHGRLVSCEIERSSGRHARIKHGELEGVDGRAAEPTFHPRALADLYVEGGSARGRGPLLLGRR